MRAERRQEHMADESGGKPGKPGMSDGVAILYLTALCMTALREVADSSVELGL